MTGQTAVQIKPVTGRQAAAIQHAEHFTADVISAMFSIHSKVGSKPHHIEAAIFAVGSGWPQAVIDA